MAVLKRDPPPLQQPIAHQGSLITTTPWALWFNKLLATVEFAPADPNTSVQFNNGGVFGGSAKFTFNPTAGHDGEVLFETAEAALYLGTESAPADGSAAYVVGQLATARTQFYGLSVDAYADDGSIVRAYGAANYLHVGIDAEGGIGTNSTVDVSAVTVDGVTAVVATANPNGSTVQALFGVHGTIAPIGGTTIGDIGSAVHGVYFAGASTATRIGALSGRFHAGSGATSPIGFGLFLDAPEINGSAAIDAYYGLLIQDIVRPTDYAIYTNAGPIRLGEIAAPAALTYAVVVDDDGVLSSTATPPGSGINQLTGDVTAGPGTGSQVATIAAHAVTFAKMQTIATQTLIGRDTAGTGDPESISISQALDWLTT